MKIFDKIYNKGFHCASLIAVTFLLLSACASKNYPALETAEYVEPDRFSGKWYVIANIPYFAEKNKVGSYTIYKERKDGVYDDIFVSRSGDFSSPEKQLKGRVVIQNESNTRWKSTFYWVVNFTFDVVHIEGASAGDSQNDYQLALLGHPSRDYGWVMARTNTISEEKYLGAMTVFEDRGYDTTKFLKVPQFAEQIGQQGFQ